MNSRRASATAMLTALAFLAACQPAGAPEPKSEAKPDAAPPIGRALPPPIVPPDSPYAPIVNAWTCRSEGGLNVRGIMRYDSDGRFTSSTTASNSGYPSRELTGTTRGSWSISGNQISETPEEVEIFAVRVNGIPMRPGSPDYENARQALESRLNITTTIRIERVTQTELVLVHESGARRECRTN